ncbi:bifunctional diaminohydroxyphosphoribosylaminopyrimidine deaminase/5-amino-6-(5-phosphoribosylamino)uracil reductase RibD [Pelagibacteraceae bacterium]|nr:bifunctional diaminohydroxyphosphoribosylaminopyrimidine deaminase/5-amino-6-(5-phosphoribosylamino)uracil reductase RibD [Pelagibacteraceae bacterium]
MSTNQNRDLFYTKLAFQQANINLGSTKSNPSVGCVIVKNDSVISSGRTSLNGRPHAEANALKKKKNYIDSHLYVTLEPCSHYGKTPPCVKKIIEKKIKKVVFSIADVDFRSKNKAQKYLNNKKIFVKKLILKKWAEKFYQSYFLQSSNEIPFIDAKLAISKDYFTINKKKKWITNSRSRNLGNFLRSKYDCLLTTSETINKDNPLLNCRIEGLEKKTPSLIIFDRYFKINKNIKILKENNRKIYIFTTVYNSLKENYFRKKGVKIIKFSRTNDNDLCLKKMIYKIKILGLSRIFVESGSTFLSQLLKNNLIKNLYLFKSSKKLSSIGRNNSSLLQIKKIKILKKDKIKVNLYGDSLYKVNL